MTTLDDAKAAMFREHIDAMRGISDRQAAKTDEWAKLNFKIVDEFTDSVALSNDIVKMQREDVKRNQSA